MQKVFSWLTGGKKGRQATDSSRSNNSNLVYSPDNIHLVNNNNNNGNPNAINAIDADAEAADLNLWHLANYYGTG